MNLIIINHTPSRVPRRHLSNLLSFVVPRLVRQRALPASDQGKDLSLVFLGRSKAKQLNRQFRGKDYATDVLSFEAIETDSLGELVFCPEVLKTQAREHGLSYRDELAYMTLHGILHLLGFEHEDGGSGAKQMFAIQEKIFNAFIDGH
jgi:probable rRNA maturation factor